MSVKNDRPDALARYSAGEISAISARRAFGGITYGDLLRMLARDDLPFPNVPVSGREAEIARARAWMFPAHDRVA